MSTKSAGRPSEVGSKSVAIARRAAEPAITIVWGAGCGEESKTPSPFSAPLDHSKFLIIKSAARSVFKLDELQQKYKFLARGQHVLDLGCRCSAASMSLSDIVMKLSVCTMRFRSPGSWTQFAAEVVGPQGRVLGIDLTPVSRTWPPHVAMLQADVFKWQPDPSMLSSFDVMFVVRILDSLTCVRWFSSSHRLCCTG